MQSGSFGFPWKDKSLSELWKAASKDYGDNDEEPGRYNDANRCACIRDWNNCKEKRHDGGGRNFVHYSNN